MSTQASKLTTAAFDLLSGMIGRGYPSRISCNPYRDEDYTLDGDHVNAKLVQRLLRDGYFEGNPAAPHRPLYFDCTAQALALRCPRCRGAGSVFTSPDDHDTQTCPQCSGRRILAPGTDFTPPYKIAEPRQRFRRTPRTPSTLTRALDTIAAMEVKSFKRPPVTPDRAGYYWIALDDGQSFEPKDWLGGGNILAGIPGPYLVRLEFVDEEWRAVMCDVLSGQILFSEGPASPLVRVSWATSAFGVIPTSCFQELRITWLLRLEAPELPEQVQAQ